eukprot:CAMPEP_0114038364 /NCGR_PEP_ID=MMETSP1339-20121228/2489_1 /TAXON_ID=94617 /ORGANISM="Fibrocapsa japonica" /LENGTH=38 /assembly_acc=CAM_ASM_000762
MKDSYSSPAEGLLGLEIGPGALPAVADSAEVRDTVGIG